MPSIVKPMQVKREPSPGLEGKSDAKRAKLKLAETEELKSGVKVDVKVEVNTKKLEVEVKAGEMTEAKRIRKEVETVPKVEVKGMASSGVEVGVAKNLMVKEESEVGIKVENVYVPTAIPDELFEAPKTQTRRTTELQAQIKRETLDAPPNQTKQTTFNAPPAKTKRKMAPTKTVPAAATTVTTQKKPKFVSEKARRKRAREDKAMVDELGPLRKAEIRRLQGLGTKEALEKIKTMHETDKRRHQLLQRWKGTSYPERMEGMTNAEKTTYENYRAEYRQAQALGEVEAAQKKTAEKKTIKRKLPKENSEQPERQRKLTKRDHKERRRLPREDFIGEALLLARKIHDKRLEHTQRDGPYYLRSKGSPSRQVGEEGEIVRIEDVMTGLGYAAWRMEEDPSIFEEYDAAAANLSPPPSPQTAFKTYSYFIHNRSLRQEDVDDLYYDFWAKDTYRRVVRCSSKSPERQGERLQVPADTSLGMDEVERADAEQEEEDGEYEVPEPQLEEISDESEVEHWLKSSLRDKPIVIDESYSEEIKIKDEKFESLKKEGSPIQPIRIKEEKTEPLGYDDSDSEPISRGRRRILRVLAPKDDLVYGDSDLEDTSTDEDSMEVKQLLNRPRLTRSTRRESDHIFLL